MKSGNILHNLWTLSLVSVIALGFTLMPFAGGVFVPNVSASSGSVGHSFTNYSSPSASSSDIVVDDDGGEDYQSVSAAIDKASSSDTVLVKGGSYDSFHIDKRVSVVAESAPDTASSSDVDGANTNDSTANGTGILITADDASVKGFNVTADVYSSEVNARGIDVQAADVTVESNKVYEVRAQERPIGIFIWGDKSDVDNTAVKNNKVLNVQASELTGTDGGRDESKVKGIALDGDANQEGVQHTAENVEIKHNTIKNIGGNGNAAMASGININGGVPKNFVVNWNDITDIDHNEGTDEFGSRGGPRHPVAQAVYISGLDKVDNIGAPGENHKVSHNHFRLSGTDATVDVQYGYDDKVQINAANNYWGQDGVEVLGRKTTQAGGNGVKFTPWYATPDFSEDVTVTADGTNQLYTDSVKEAVQQAKWNICQSGQVDLNQANKSELETITRVGSSTASNIITYRENTSKLHTIDYLTEIDGNAEITLQKIKDEGLACADTPVSSPVSNVTVTADTGSYTEHVPIETPLTLSSNGDRTNTTLQADLSTGTKEVVRVDDASDVTIDGFTIKDSNPQTNPDSEAFGVLVTKDSDNFTLKDAKVTKIRDTARATGIGVNSIRNNSNTTVIGSTTIKNTKFTDIKTTEFDPDVNSDSKAKGVALNGDVQDTTLQENMFDDIGDSQETKKTHAISITEATTTGPTNFSISKNNFSNIHSGWTDGSKHGAKRASTAVEGPVAIFVGNYNDMGQTHTVNENNFNDGVVRNCCGSAANDLVATNNYWGHPTGPSNEGSGLGVVVSKDVNYDPFYINAARNTPNTNTGIGSAQVSTSSQIVSVSVPNASTSVDVHLPGTSTASSVSVVESSSPTGDASDTGDSVSYLDISADQVVSGDTDITLSVSASKITNPNRVVVRHFTGGQWNDLSTSFDGISNGVATFSVTASSLSPFAITETEPSDEGTSGGGGGGVASARSGGGGGDDDDDEGDDDQGEVLGEQDTDKDADTDASEDVEGDGEVAGEQDTDLSSMSNNELSQLLSALRVELLQILSQLDRSQQ